MADGGIGEGRGKIFLINHSWRCNWCWNDFWTQTDAIKIVFCDAQNWNKQIEKVFESGKPATGGWRNVACPQNQYANKISMRWGW